MVAAVVETESPWSSEDKEKKMAELNYTTRSIRRHGADNMWEITLSHRNPITGEIVRTYHKVEA
jgi:hypothetical protein